MSITDRLDHIRSRLPLTTLQDEALLSRRFEETLQKSRGSRVFFRRLASLEKTLEASLLKQERRLSKRPKATYPGTLPITSHKDEIVQAVKRHQVVIVSGETGCGKSTQLPKMCLEAGRGIRGIIGCTQPRRIAATTIARRIAEELGQSLGQSVGYKIRFEDKSGPDTFVKVMTDGVLLAETQGDPKFRAYDTLIIDEAHERSLNIDFLLGIIKTLLPETPELKIIITSATLETEKFSDAFGGAPVLHVGGRLYPVAVEYMAVDPELEDRGEVTYVDMAVKAVDRLRAKRRFGDVLAFMPTEQDILETCERLAGRRYPGTTVLPLFARLRASEQGRVYSVTGPKIVVATNVAETSLTIPGIKYVIDTGLARISQYLPRTRTTTLPVTPISRSSADQRKGRCGRVQKGICIRLYPEEDYESRPAFTPPEILRSSLAEVILRMIFLNLGDPASFPFLDKPKARSIKDGYDLLLELGAIARQGPDHVLTEKGRLMARMPLDPRISRMLLEAQKEGCVSEVAVIASALSIQDPRERPAEKLDQADQMHAPFKDKESDFVTLLNIWNRYHREWAALGTQNKMRKFCKAHFLSFPRMREWVYTYDQITAILKDHKIPLATKSKARSEGGLNNEIHRSILSGFLSNIAVKKGKNIYQAARGREVMLFPGSTLFNRNAAWIVAAEMVKTSRLFARTSAKINEKWLEALGGDLCKSTFFDAHWDKNRGEVRAYEQVTLYGLVIVPRRPVSYGAINPDEAHRLFIQSALVEGNVKKSLPFLSHNLALVHKIRAMEDKLRRRDILVGEDVMANLYSRNLQGVCDMATLKKVIRQKGSDRFLRFSEEELLLFRPDPSELARYPDSTAVRKARFKTTYKFAPGEEEDGVTVHIPAGAISRIPPESLEWPVPGFLKEKVTALIKGLPKRYRKQLVPVNRTVDAITEEMEQGDRSLLSSLAEFLYRRFGVDIPASVLAEVPTPEYLRTRIALTDHRGREVEAGRDLHHLATADSRPSSSAASQAWLEARDRWERKEVTTWNFGSLPESLSLEPYLMAYPGLEAHKSSVSLRLFEDHEEALISHRKGVQRLLVLHFAKDLKFLRRNLTLPQRAAQAATYFGGLQAVEESLFQALVKSLFHKNLRTPEAFKAHAEAVRPLLFQKGNAMQHLVIKVLDAYHKTRTTICTLEGANASSKGVLALCATIRCDLDRLVPPNFPELYTLDRLAHLPRYLKAMQLRAERGANDLEKDRSKAAQADGFNKALHHMTTELSPRASRDKRQAVEDYGWMIEEFKVSLFAQELKTPFPVSRERLERKKREIERMV
jgi:ATP-dependent helicase HrpA